uniref:Uncharacterized protein n=1 Tax=Arundo donax TaxID=35708 RepID=A0A0A9EDG2_ARUDO
MRMVPLGPRNAAATQARRRRR